MTRTSFASSLAAFRQASPWLGDEHEPELTALGFLAETLDGEPRSPAPLVAQWGLILRNLRKQAPQETGEEDELEALLKASR